MRNEMSKTTFILNHLKTLPYFTLEDILVFEKKHYFLRILLSRFSKSGKIVRLKKGMYVATDYLEESKRQNLFLRYSEFVSSIIYEPSYLSLDYVLYERNILTEIPKNFTLVSTKKTKQLKNELGHFYYHSIRPELFCGYKILTENKLSYKKATTAKALFDFLYFRKDLLLSDDAVVELRLNLGELNAGDINEFKKYVNIENSKKMFWIYEIIIKLWKDLKKS